MTREILALKDLRVFREKREKPVSLDLTEFRDHPERTPSRWLALEKRAK